MFSLMYANRFLLFILIGFFVLIFAVFRGNSDCYLFVSSWKRFSFEVIVIQSFGRRYSFIGIDHQHLFQQVLTFLRDISEVLN